MNPKQLLVDVLGWYGAGAILLAYAFVSFGLISSASLAYQLLNLTGAVGIVISSVSKKDYPPAVLNTVWTLIAVIALLNLLR